MTASIIVTTAALASIFGKIGGHAVRWIGRKITKRTRTKLDDRAVEAIATYLDNNPHVIEEAIRRVRGQL